MRRYNDVEAFLQSIAGKRLIARFARRGLNAFAFFRDAHMNAFKFDRALFAFRTAQVRPLVGISFKAVMDVDCPHAGNQRLALLVEKLRGDIKERH